MKDEVLTTKEVADYLRIDIRTVYRLSKKGKIPGVKVGHSWRYIRSDIEALLNRPPVSKPSQDLE